MTVEQTATAAFVAALIVQGIKVFFIGLLGLPKPAKIVFTVIAAVVAIVMAYLYTGPVSLPNPQVDPIAFAQELLGAAVAVFGVAAPFYAFLLERILAGLDGVTFKAWFRRPILAP